MKSADFRQLLVHGPLLCDGAMGTQLQARGLLPGANGELWCIEHPNAVAAIHRDYAQAGARLITTNTFGANRAILARHGLAGRTRELNLAGARVARAGAGPDAIILGDVGPFGDFLEPVGVTTEAELQDIFTEQITALRDGGADGIIIETMADPAEAAIAVLVARQVADWPVIATFAFSRMGDGSFRTMTGATTQEVVAAMREARVDAVGANCGTSLTPPDYIALAGALVAAAQHTPVIVQPNAGSPQAGHWVPADPGSMAHAVPALLAAGVKIIGGCCGTTPAHIAAMAGAMTEPQHCGAGA
jgi:5-methyltetrahydrofolate--homocysteine methyltransferase